MEDFLCPRCSEHLRIGDHLIFKVKNTAKQTALLLLSSQIGNYTSMKHPTFEFKEGEFLDFYCPLCNASLKSAIHPNLAWVILQDETGKRNDVYFSQIAGEHSTFSTDGKTVYSTGEDAGRYTYFKIGDKFKKYL